jgi:hypothetical protein
MKQGTNEVGCFGAVTVLTWFPKYERKDASYTRLEFRLTQAIWSRAHQVYARQLPR